jgi:hypothetical protein
MSPRRQLSTKRLPLVAFLAGLALVAVVSGYVLERYILGSFVATKGKAVTPPKEQVATVTKTEITVPGASLWRVQIGSYNSKQQADQAKDAAQKKGFGAFVSGTGPFRVVAGVTKTKDAAQKLSTSLSKAGYKPYVAEYKYNPATYSVTLGDANYVPVFKNGVLSMADAVPAEAGAWDYYYAGKKNEFVSSATGVSTTLTNVAKKLAGTAPPKGAESLHASLSTLLEKAAANSNDMKTFAEKGGKDLYVKAATTYMEVLESFERFMAQLPK